jgi:hypothetical protein
MNPDDAQKLLVAALSALLSALTTVLIQRTNIKKAVEDDVSHKADNIVDSRFAQSALEAMSNHTDKLIKLLSIQLERNEEVSQLRDQLVQIEASIHELKEHDLSPQTGDSSDS